MAMNQYGNQMYTPIGQNGPSISANSNQVPMTPANQAFSNTISNSIVWVETDDEAKTWMVGPNNRVFIFVGDNETLYIKEKNSDGRPLKTEIYDMNRRQVIEDSQVDLSGYVKKEDVQAMIEAAVSKAVSETKKNRNFQNHGKNGNRNGGYEE